MEESFGGNIQTGSICPNCFGHYEEVQQTNALGSKKEPSVQQTDALTHFGENLCPPCRANELFVEFVCWSCGGCHIKTQKVLWYETYESSVFFLISSKGVSETTINDQEFIKKRRKMEPQQQGDKLWLTLAGLWSWTLHWFHSFDQNQNKTNKKEHQAAKSCLKKSSVCQC